MVALVQRHCAVVLALAVLAAASASAALSPLRKGAAVAVEGGGVCGADSTFCGGDSCCPFKRATCCGDGKTCCPEGFLCDGSRCLDPLVARPLLNAGSQECKSHQATASMCANILGKCCPSDFICDKEEQLCVKPVLSSARKPASQQTWLSPLWSVFMAPLVCEDGSTCANSQTCCLLTTGAYGCCPYAMASCCADRVNCCPQGYYCTLDAVFCLPNASIMSKPSAKLQKSGTAKRSAPALRQMEPTTNDETCTPDGYSDSCETGDKCCWRSDGSVGCCPHTNGVCCDQDKDFCCPNGYVCDIGHKRCVKT